MTTGPMWAPCLPSDLRPSMCSRPTRLMGLSLARCRTIVIARNRIEHWTTGFNTTLPTAGTEARMTVRRKVVGFLIEDNLIIDGQFIGIDMIRQVTAVVDRQQSPHPAYPGGFLAATRHYQAEHRPQQCNLALAPQTWDLLRWLPGYRGGGQPGGGFPGYCFAMSTEEDQFLIAQIILRYNTSVNCGTAIFEIRPWRQYRESYHSRPLTSFSAWRISGTGSKPKPMGRCCAGVRPHRVSSRIIWR